jgi:hypothetical protein
LVGKETKQKDEVEMDIFVSGPSMASILDGSV